MALFVLSTQRLNCRHNGWRNINPIKTDIHGIRFVQLILDEILIKFVFFNCNVRYALSEVFVGKKNAFFGMKKDKNWFRIAFTLHVFTFTFANQCAGKSKRTIGCKEYKGGKRIKAQTK